MAEITCTDGSRLGVHPVPVLDRQHLPYEVTLRLTRNGAEFGEVGERCGYFLDNVSAQLACARAEGSGESARWGPDDRFPTSTVESGVRAWAAGGDRDPGAAWDELARYLPRDRELFAFRHRDPDDLCANGELRCTVRTEKAWVRGDGGPGGGRWRLARRAVVEAWGESGLGLRAVLDSTGLAEFLDRLVAEAGRVSAPRGREPVAAHRG